MPRFQAARLAFARGGFALALYILPRGTAQASRRSSQGHHQQTRLIQPPYAAAASSAPATRTRPPEAMATQESLTPPRTDAELLQAGYRYALALTHHPEDAEDLAQEAWLNLSRRYGRVESRAILFTTVRNLFIDQCRRRKVVQFESMDQEEPPELPSISPKEPGVKGDLDRLL